MPRLGAGSHLTWVQAGTLVEFGQGDHTTLFSQVLKAALILCPDSINSGQLTLPRAAQGGILGFSRPDCLPSADWMTQTDLADKQALPGRGVGCSERNSF